MRDRLAPAEKIRRVLGYFAREHPPTFLYDALRAVPLDDEPAVRALIEGLACPEWRGALGSARALGARRPRPDLAVPALAAALGHGEDSVRTGAAEALGAYGPAAESAVPAIVRRFAAEEDPHPRMSYAEALGSIARRPDLVLPALLRHLEAAEPDDYSVPKSLEAVAAFGAAARSTAKLIEPLAESGDWQWRLAALRTLAAVDPDPARVVAAVRRGNPDSLSTWPSDDRPDEIVRGLLGIPGLRDWKERSLLRRFVPGCRDLGPLVEALRDPATADLAAELLAVRGDASVVGDLAAVPATPWTIRALAALGKGDARAVEALRRAHDGTHRDLARRALRKLGVRLPAPAGADFGQSVLAVHRYPWPVAGEGDGLVVPLHRVLKAAPAEDWADDEDEFAVARISAEGIRVQPLPVAWPLKPNGANGAKRRIRLCGRFRGGHLAWIHSPFSDKRGWGADNFLFLVRPDGTWTRLDKGGNEIPAAGWIEDPEAAISFGELIVRREGGVVRVVADCTPYHLDDWEHSEAPVADWPDPDPGTDPRPEVEARGPELWEVGGRKLADVEDGCRERVGPGASPLGAARDGDRVLLSIRTRAGDALVVLAQ